MNLLLLLGIGSVFAGQAADFTKRTGLTETLTNADKVYMTDQFGKGLKMVGNHYEVPTINRKYFLILDDKSKTLLTKDKLVGVIGFRKKVTQVRKQQPYVTCQNTQNECKCNLEVSGYQGHVSFSEKCTLVKKEDTVIPNKQDTNGNCFIKLNVENFWNKKQGPSCVIVPPANNILDKNEVLKKKALEKEASDLAKFHAKYLDSELTHDGKKKLKGSLVALALVPPHMDGKLVTPHTYLKDGETVIRYILPTNGKEYEMLVPKQYQTHVHKDTRVSAQNIFVQCKPKKNSCDCIYRLKVTENWTSKKQACSSTFNVGTNPNYQDERGLCHLSLTFPENQWGPKAKYCTYTVPSSPNNDALIEEHGLYRVPIQSDRFSTVLGSYPILKDDSTTQWEVSCSQETDVTDQCKCRARQPTKMDGGTLDCDAESVGYPVEDKFATVCLVEFKIKEKQLTCLHVGGTAPPELSSAALSNHDQASKLSSTLDQASKLSRTSIRKSSAGTSYYSVDEDEKIQSNSIDASRKSTADRSLIDPIAESPFVPLPKISNDGANSVVSSSTQTLLTGPRANARQVFSDAYAPLVPPPPKVKSDIASDKSKIKDTDKTHLLSVQDETADFSTIKLKKDSVDSQDVSFN